jgi:hypothetical protein
MSYGIVPQFNYGIGFATAFNPTYAAIDKIPINALGQSATRHDSITTSGLQQSITERVDQMFELDFPVIPESDLTGWSAFIAWAIQGQQFQYAPDATNLASFVTCYLVATEMIPKRVGYKLYSYTLQCRIVLTAEVGS